MHIIKILITLFNFNSLCSDESIIIKNRKEIESKINNIEKEFEKLIKVYDKKFEEKVNLIKNKENI